MCAHWDSEKGYRGDSLVPRACVVLSWSSVFFSKPSNSLDRGKALCPLPSGAFSQLPRVYLGL